MKTQQILGTLSNILNKKTTIPRPIICLSGLLISLLFTYGHVSWYLNPKCQEIVRMANGIEKGTLKEILLVQFPFILLSLLVGLSILSAVGIFKSLKPFSADLFEITGLVDGLFFCFLTSLMFVFWSYILGSSEIFYIFTTMSFLIFFIVLGFVNEFSS